MQILSLLCTGKYRLIEIKFKIISLLKHCKSLTEIFESGHVKMYMCL